MIHIVLPARFATKALPKASLRSKLKLSRDTSQLPKTSHMSVPNSLQRPQNVHIFRTKHEDSQARLPRNETTKSEHVHPLRTTGPPGTALAPAQSKGHQITRVRTPSVTTLEKNDLSLSPRCTASRRDAMPIVGLNDPQPFRKPRTSVWTHLGVWTQEKGDPRTGQP